MDFEASTIDDLMYDVLSELTKREFNVSPSKGVNSEIFGATLQLNNPRARLSRTETRGKTFSALGEFLWYMSKSNRLEYIKYYISKYVDYTDDGETIYGGYGPRLFNMRGKYNQVERVIKLLKEKPYTRKAVIQLFDVEDLAEKHNDVPCTCTLQFILREGKLNMFTSMRSNDAYWGLPHDVFCFTMLQEIIARSIDAELGIYKHVVGSLHLYQKHENEANEYLREGFQSTKFPMPEMPKGDPWQSIMKIIKFEKEVRTNLDSSVESLGLDTYWSDLLYMLKIHAMFKKKEHELIESEMKKITDPVYIAFIQKKIKDRKDRSHKFAKSSTSEILK